MKRIFWGLVFLFCLGQNQILFAQFQKPVAELHPIDLQGGVGLNLFNFSAAFDIDFIQTKVSPAFNLSGDYWVGRFFTAGLGYSYQRITLSDTTGGSNLTAAINRNNIGLRAILHTNKDVKGVDFFFGARIGYDLFSLSRNTASSLAGENFFHLYMHQFFLGTKYVFEQKILIFLELAAGPPYIFNIGGGYRF